MITNKTFNPTIPFVKAFFNYIKAPTVEKSKWFVDKSVEKELLLEPRLTYGCLPAWICLKLLFFNWRWDCQSSIDWICFITFWAFLKFNVKSWIEDLNSTNFPKLIKRYFRNLINGNFVCVFQIIFYFNDKKYIKNLILRQFKNFISNFLIFLFVF